ncbi:MAG: DEAD/DEAH box helicase [Candidatus Sifarchaeia archaeon]
MAVELKVTEVIPKTLESIFSFESFNKMQSAVFDIIFNTDENVVVAAPTASGKTVIGELAILRALIHHQDDFNKKVVYIAPYKALSYEKLDEWTNKFEPLGYNVYVTTGETEIEPRKANKAHIIISTPEKVDSSSRKFRSATYDFINRIDTIIIDEVHLLDSPERGGALEVLISRLRKINSDIRIVALSATMKNIEDVAAWLGAKNSGTFVFSDIYRPVKLEATVCGYKPDTKNRWNNKHLKIQLSYDLIVPHIDAGGQALVFVSSRRGTVDTAQKILQNVSENEKMLLGNKETELLGKKSKEIVNDILRACFVEGIAFHHAGLSRNDREIVESAFKNRLLKVLASTSTLAWGVNLPARVVVIQDTTVYDPLKGKKEISPLDLLQMLGRSGRPQFDNVGYGIIITEKRNVEYYRGLLTGKEIESKLTETLEEHLNAEISLNFIKTEAEISDWLKSTFLYSSQKDELQIQEIMDTTNECIERLITDGFISKTEQGLVSTPLGSLTSKFYLRLDTGKLFFDAVAVNSHKIIDDEEILALVSKASEFNDMVVRRNERRIFRDVIESYSASGYIKDLKKHQEKVFAILLASLKGGVQIDIELQTDARVIRQNANRLLSALQRFCDEFSESILIREKVKRLSVLLEYSLPEEFSELLQVKGIGVRIATLLASANVMKLKDLIQLSVEDMIKIGIKKANAEKIRNNITEMPIITTEWDIKVQMNVNESQKALFKLFNWSFPVRINATLLLNKKQLIEQKLFLKKEEEWIFPVYITSSKLQTILCESCVSFIDWEQLPIVDKKEIKVVRVRPKKTLEISKMERKPKREKLAVISSKAIGKCKNCGHDLVKEKDDEVICTLCGISYGIPKRAKVLPEHSCERCGLPEMQYIYGGYDITCCIDLQCQNPEKIVKERFEKEKYPCPKCGSPLVFLRRIGLAVGCSDYYDEEKPCKTAFVLPNYIKLPDERCQCGLPLLKSKNKIRCLNQSCEYSGRDVEDS